MRLKGLENILGLQNLVLTEQLPLQIGLDVITDPVSHNI